MLLRIVKKFVLLTSFFLLLSSYLPSATPTDALYSTLDPTSLIQQLSFYELYPETEQGKQALKKASALIQGEEAKVSLPLFQPKALIDLIARGDAQPLPQLMESELQLIEKVGARLKNRSLTGRKARSLEEILALPSQEVDIGRGVLLLQFHEDFVALRRYEAALDLMALQILGRLPRDATAPQKVAEISRFIFEEMRFRFPPHSLYADAIDTYTFLTSVLDSRRGVCLGVSILYLTLAQRVGLKLEILTPPGHIFLRYAGDHHEINIETTARGIHIPTENYLSVGIHTIQTRQEKEVIGLALFNEASLTWSQGNLRKALSLYENATRFMPDDPLLKMLYGITHLYAGSRGKGRALLKEIAGKPFPWAMSPETLPEDILAGEADETAVMAVFQSVDENRTSISKKLNELEEILQEKPRCRAVIFQLAVGYLQLGKRRKAHETLIRYHNINPNDPLAEYYLSALSLERHDYVGGWRHLKLAEKLSSKESHVLRQLRAELLRLCPEP